MNADYDDLGINALMFLSTMVTWFISFIYFVQCITFYCHFVFLKTVIRQR